MELVAVAEIELDEFLGVGEAVRQMAVGAGGGELVAEFGFVEGDGDFELTGFGEPDASLTELGVDGFGE